MTRKRYVKLLMGHGYSRNTANRCAERALAIGRTFRQDYGERRASPFYSSPIWAEIRTRYLGRWKIEKEPEG